MKSAEKSLKFQNILSQPSRNKFAVLSILSKDRSLQSKNKIVRIVSDNKWVKPYLCAKQSESEMRWLAK